MVRWARAAILPVALAGLLALAGAVLGRIYSDGLLLPLCAGAAAGSVATGVAARRLPSWTAAPISALLLAGYTVLALHLAAPAGLTAAVLRDALANGIPRLLTALIPVEPEPDTVLAPIVAVWLTGLAATEIAVRGGRVLFGCLPPVLLYVAALYVVGPNAGPATGPTLAFAALVAAALLGGDPASARLPARVRAHALATAAAGLLTLLALVAVAGPWVSRQVSATPADPRRYVEPPRVDSLDESPLNRISGWALSPAQPLLEFRPGPDPARAGGEVRLRLAVLPDYDGVTWRVGGVYRNAGRVLPEQPVLPGATVADARQEITVTGLTGRLLPAIPAPATVSGARVAYDAGTGTLIRPEGLSHGLRYTATSRVQTPDLNLLPIAEAPSGDAVARYLSVGSGVPEQIQRLAEHLADGNGGAYDRAVAIEEFLAEHYRAVGDAPSGHAYPNLAHFLFGRAEQGGRVGTSEQFAAAYALLARLIGLPSRIVVGFTAPAAGGEVTGGDALAWPEVLFDGLGWVAFDPMPKSDEARPVEEDLAPRPTTPPPTPSEPAPSDTPSAASSALLAAPSLDAGPPAFAVAGGAGGSVLVVAVIGGLAVVQMRRAQRRRRLFTGGPGERIAGAWLELTDALRLAGRPIPAHLSATEAAEYAAMPPPAARRFIRLRRATPSAEAAARLPSVGHEGSAAPSSASGAGAPRGESREVVDPASDAADGPYAGWESPPLPDQGAGPEPVPSLAELAAGREAVSPLPNMGAGRKAVSPSADMAAGREAMSRLGDLAAGREPVAPLGDLAARQESLPPSASGRQSLPPLDDLVAAVNVVGFAPDQADATQADRAATQVLAFSAALRRDRPRWARIWWSLRPGPLRWHRDD
ncbi:transglutaminase domain-containing protein [Actinoplanes aureus]|uniref:Transglutaminase domain-containing protein n=1 Tax=Actinoplanes aureus TaxID=2792083 RepID=A0A931G104_9ACTN|nr:transglutaminase domain-containing protein [Actinoplanes aureus]MBG0567343.1 transglutaminase domain-containing protein [Actinoplanes aureus]